MSSDAAGPGEVPIRRASTVMLLRDGADGIEVFTLQRASTMVFASGMTVFPGGGVDSRDIDPDVPWRGPGGDWWSRQWRIGEREALAQVIAAVRELFEETGVLLAGDEPATTGDPAVHESDRVAVADHRLGLGDVLRRRGRVLRADLLRPWARWITPAGAPRRYDTFFFAAALPDGVDARPVTTEADTGGWHRPADVLRAERDGRVGLMLPTWTMLTELAEAHSVADVIDRAREVRPVTPELVTADGEVVHVRIDGRDYDVGSNFRPTDVAPADARPETPGARPEPPTSTTTRTAGIRRPSDEGKPAR